MKSNLDKLFKTDSKMEEDGIDFVIDSDTSFRVRHFSTENTRVKAAIANHYKPYARQIEMETLDDNKNREIKIKLFYDVCLVSWKGVKIDEKEVECTKENALTLFNRLPKLLNTLWDHANNFNNYREELGNS